VIPECSGRLVGRRRCSIGLGPYITAEYRAAGTWMHDALDLRDQWTKAGCADRRVLPLY